MTYLLYSHCICLHTFTRVIPFLDIQLGLCVVVYIIYKHANRKVILFSVTHYVPCLSVLFRISEFM